MPFHNTAPCFLTFAEQCLFYGPITGIFVTLFQVSGQNSAPRPAFFGLAVKVGALASKRLGLGSGIFIASWHSLLRTCIDLIQVTCSSSTFGSLLVVFDIFRILKHTTCMVTTRLNHRLITSGV